MGPLFCKRVSFTLFLAFLLTAVLVSPGFGSSTVKNIRYSVQLDHIRVVLDLSRRTPYQIVAFENPDRIALNLRRVKIDSNARPPRISSGVVKKIRVNHLAWGSQVVLDLHGKAEWKDFVLPEANGRPNRIVIDVYPSRQLKSQIGAAYSPYSKGDKVLSAGKAGTLTGRETLDKTSIQTPPADRKFIIAIDPGHGGMDPGALGRYGLVEKHLALDVAKRVVGEINKRKGFKAVLTRTNDVYLTLPQRTRIAQRKGADAFVSIHMNAVKKRRVRGTEIFFISPAGAEAKVSNLLSNKKRAEAELGLEMGQSAEILSLILDMNQQAMMHRSSLLAEEINKQMEKKGFPPPRGIKQRSFSVLKTIVMPSVLVEAGFISNHQDGKFLKSLEGREKVSKAITEGVVSFFERYPPPSREERDVIVHRVKKGETLWRIAKLYGSNVHSIREVNGIRKSNVIRVGQELLIMNQK